MRAIVHVVFVFVGVLRFRCLFLQRIKNIRHLVQGRITHVYDAQCTHICTKCVCMCFFDILTVFTICPYQVAKILVFIWLIWYFFLLTDFVDKVIFFHMYTSLHIYVLSSFTFSLFLFFFCFYLDRTSSKECIVCVYKYLFSVSFPNTENRWIVLKL